MYFDPSYIAVLQAFYDFISSNQTVEGALDAPKVEINDSQVNAAFIELSNLPKDTFENCYSSIEKVYKKFDFNNCLLKVPDILANDNYIYHYFK